MLQDGLIASASRVPDAEALVAPDGRLSYAALDALSNRLGRRFISLGVRPGDRIGLWLEKSAAAVATMHAALRIGAAYVPIDPFMPAARARIILEDCAVRLLVSTSARLSTLGQADFTPPPTVTIDGSDWDVALAQPSTPLPALRDDDSRLAYILYTSGSTGTPKGVCISHRNALSFVTWAVNATALGPRDRVANHAPFHFDLSVFDLYASCIAGASVILLPDSLSFAPARLVDVLVRERITTWYSVPSVLVMMTEQAGLLTRDDLHDLPLRVVLFAGEPFPIGKLRPLREALPDVRFFNFYGPTETNVCTAYEVRDIAPDRLLPVPIGGAVSGNRVWAQTAADTIAEVGEEGELLVQGPTVMLGYWGQPPHGIGPYATGDIVRRIDVDCFAYVGRRDAMLKVRGYRIEPGDIEAALSDHAAIAECAVTTRGDGLQTKLVACIVCRPEIRRPTLLELKAHLASRLPRYMIIDSVSFLERLPRNRNGKIDRRELAAIANTVRSTGVSLDAS